MSPFSPIGHYGVSLLPLAQSQLAALDKPVRQRIANYINDRIIPHPDPIKLSEPLVGKFTGMRRFRVGDYRLLADFDLDQATLTIRTISHRRDTYD